MRKQHTTAKLHILLQQSKALLLLLWLYASLLPAQVGLLPYTPKAEGALDAVFQTLQEQGMQNPELQGIITFSGNFNFQGSPISLAFDLETGKSILWIYAVAGSFNGTDSVVFLPMVRLPFVGFTPVPVPLPSLPAPLTNPVDPDWMDTDEMLQHLNNDGVYQAFHQAYPDSLPDFVWLSKVLVPIPSTQWTLQWIGSDVATSMLCRVNALTGSTQCIAIPVGVEAQQYEQSRVAIFPNPATDLLLIKAEIPITQLLSIRLFNARGERIPEFVPTPNGSSNEFLVPVSHLPRGLYFVVIQLPDQQYQFPVILR